MKKILIVNPNIKGVIVASKDGNPITSTLPSEIEEGLAASATAKSYLSAEESLLVAKIGEMKRIILEGAEGNIITIEASPDALLTAYVTREVSLGMVFLNLQSAGKKINKAILNKEPFKILLLDKDIEDTDYELPYPSLFKPPSPPGDLGISGQAQLKRHITKEDLREKPYCKNCGSIVSEGQSLCHVCKKKII